MHQRNLHGTTTTTTSPTVTRPAVAWNIPVHPHGNEATIGYYYRHPQSTKKKTVIRQFRYPSDPPDSFAAALPIRPPSFSHPRMVNRLGFWTMTMSRYPRACCGSGRSNWRAVVVVSWPPMTPATPFFDHGKRMMMTMMHKTAVHCRCAVRTTLAIVTINTAAGPAVFCLSVCPRAHLPTYLPTCMITRTCSSSFPLFTYLPTTCFSAVRITLVLLLDLLVCISHFFTLQTTLCPPPKVPRLLLLVCCDSGQLTPTAHGDRNTPSPERVDGEQKHHLPHHPCCHNNIILSLKCQGRKNVRVVRFHFELLRYTVHLYGQKRHSYSAANAK